MFFFFQAEDGIRDLTVTGVQTCALPIYQPLMEVNFVESNPIPVKAALAEMGLLEPVWRLPLVPPKAENRARIRAVLESLGLVRSEAATQGREKSHAAVAH